VTHFWPGPHKRQQVINYLKGSLNGEPIFEPHKRYLVAKTESVVGSTALSDAVQVFGIQLAEFQNSVFRG
jgi:hypothetical protein